MDPRKLVSIRRIRLIRKIPEFPNLEMAVVDNWTCAVRAGVFFQNETIVFFEIDCFLPSPTDDPRYGTENNPLHHSVTSYKGAKGIHVKSMMVGKTQEISQGVVLKLFAFPEIREWYFKDGVGQGIAKRPVREYCFASLLNVKKWEVPKAETTKSLGSPPVFFPNANMQRVQNMRTLFNNDKYKTTTYQESVKMDGSTMAVYYVRRDSKYHRSLPQLAPEAKADMRFGRVGVCSRNHDLHENGGSHFWSVALKHKLPGKLEKVNRSLAVQGELVGSSIGGNRHGFAPGEHDFYVFSIWDIETQKYLDPRETVLRAMQLGLKHVPVLAYVRIREIADSVEDLLKRAEGVDENGNKREGVVYKNLEDGRWFKVIANGYLLKHGE